MFYYPAEFPFTILGIGGAGTTVAYKFHQRTRQPNCYLLDTDDRLFVERRNIDCIKLGSHSFPTDPKERLVHVIDEETVRLSLKESQRALNDLWDNTTKKLLLIAGLGGLTASQAVPFIIHEALERKKLVYVLVWLPLRFEGPLRKSRAAASLEEIIRLADYTFIQNNINIGDRCREATLPTLYDMLDDTVIKRIESFTETDKS